MLWWGQSACRDLTCLSGVGDQVDEGVSVFVCPLPACKKQSCRFCGEDKHPGIKCEEVRVKPSPQPWRTSTVTLILAPHSRTGAAGSVARQITAAIVRMVLLALTR